MIMNKKDGALYILEYGNKWFSKNDDARLLRIDYIEGNRTPNVKLAADKTAGAAPLIVDFSSEGTEDFDRQDLKYEWIFEGNTVQSTEKNPVFTFKKPGKYKVNLKVTDEVGATTNSMIEIFVGNDLPQIAWQIDGNSTFYFDNEPINYNVNIKDKEDGTLGNGIDESQVIITMDYLAEGFDKTEIAQGHQTKVTNVKTAEGRKLMDDSDCKACHLMDKKSAGPSYQQIAKKYEAEKNKAVATLANRIIKGGNGVWGETQMSAHPQLSTKEAEVIVRYILSVNEKTVQFKPKGTYVTNVHSKGNSKGNYVFTASYTDKGANKMPAAIGQEMVVLRNSTVFFKDADAFSEGVEIVGLNKKQKAAVDISANTNVDWLQGLTNDKYLKFEAIDLTDIQKLQLNIPTPTADFVGGIVEICIDAQNGKVIGKAVLKAGNINPILTNLMTTNGKHDIYFVFKNTDKPTDMISGAISVVFLSK
jgi:cytochrome c